MLTFKKGFFSGKENEGLFNEPYGELGNLVAQTSEIPELFLKMQKGHDDRSFVIISALVVESVLDKFLGAYIPKYKKLIEDEDSFVFSTKISLIKSLELMPNLILSCAETVRKIRNKFAHDLDLDNLDKLGKDLVILRTQYNQIYSKYGETADKKSPRELFDKIASYSISGIIAYIPNVHALNKKIRAKEFVGELKLECKKEFELQIEELSKEKPLELLEKNGFEIKKYKNGITLITKKI